MIGYIIKIKDKIKDSVIRSIVKPETHSVCEIPDKVPARNETPVVIVHGTMAEKESIKKYKEAALHTGHPAGLTDYMTIKDGESLEKSGKSVSRHINNCRIDITLKHLKDLEAMKNTPEALKEYFQIDPDIYDFDQRVENLLSVISVTVDKMENLMKFQRSELLESFSSRTKDIEKELEEEVRKIGYEKMAWKVAAEIMDTISPKAILVGHSMGGFVSYALCLNPKEVINDGNNFTYDGGNGVSTVITLSSPVGKGVNKTLPSGLSSYAYNLLEKNILNPLESFAEIHFSSLSPFFKVFYTYNKTVTKEFYRNSALISSVITNPIIYAMKPGFGQITEGSDFIKSYVEGKKIPSGITAIAIFNREDGVCEYERARLDESQKNACNLEVKVSITPEELEGLRSTGPTLAHIKMALYPFEHGEEFRKEILEKPEHIIRILDPVNYDGVRWRCLSVLLENLEQDKKFFSKPDFQQVIEQIRSVASEKLPFLDSPSCLAKKIVDNIEMFTEC